MTFAGSVDDPAAVAIRELWLSPRVFFHFIATGISKNRVHAGVSF